MRERWRADASPVRHATAITHQVIAVISFGPFNCPERLSGRNDRTPAHAYEMRDQGFDVVHRSFFERWAGQGLERFIRPLRHVVHTLFDDPQTLSHFLDAHHAAVVAVSMPARRDVEFELFITGIRLLLAKIPLEAAGPQVRTGDTPLDSLLRGEGAHSLGACLENPVLHHFFVVFDQAWW